MRWFARTGDSTWKQAAVAALDYVLRVQKPSGGYPELRGLEESDGGSTVNTGIIADNLIAAFKSGRDGVADAGATCGS